MSPLIVFDVDGTLLTGAAATHLQAFADALRIMTGVSDPFHLVGGRYFCGEIPIGGLLDRQIARLCLEHAGLASPTVEGSLPAFLTQVLEAYRLRLDGGADPGSALPGVPAVLETLTRRGMGCGLVTGNAREIAGVKLAHTGIKSWFRYGGFGDEGDDRAELFPKALAEARKLGLSTEEVCYLGDTPRDILAARQAGVPMVATATGHFSQAALHAAGADVVIGGYEHVEIVCDILAERAREGIAPSGAPPNS